MGSLLRSLPLAFVVACAAPAQSSPVAETPPSTSPDPASATASPDAPDGTAAPLEPATDLYQASYGVGDRTLVFLHGGPGYNAALFEATTAEVLAARYRVVVYDRRGTGRSPAVSDGTASFTFAQASVDLDAILAGIEAPVLLAHSFGGAIALSYLESHPDFTGHVVLVNAPLSYPRSLQTIIDNCRDAYQAKGDTNNLGYLDQLEGFDAASAQYAGFVFMHGIGCGLYQPSAPTEDARRLTTRASAHEAAPYFAQSQPLPFAGFIEHEGYTTLDLSAQVERHRARLSAIYADEDRIIAPEDRARLREALGDRYVEIQGAAHNVFVDQQAAFVGAVGRLVETASPRGGVGQRRGTTGDPDGVVSWRRRTAHPGEAGRASVTTL